MNSKIICGLLFLLILTICSRPLQCKSLDIKDTVNDDFVRTQRETDDGDEYYGEYYGKLDKKTIEQVRQCEIDLPTQELCMRCAKVTKADNVYPMCCGDEDNVKSWCHDYVYFGKQ